MALLVTLVLAAAVGLRILNIRLPFVTGQDNVFTALSSIPFRFEDPGTIRLPQALLLDGHAVAAGEPLQPVTNLLLAISYILFGVGEWQARLPSILCGTGAIAVFFFLVRRIAGVTQALFAAVAFAVFPLAVLSSKYVSGVPPAWLAMGLALLFTLRYASQWVLIELLRAACFALLAALASPLAIPFLPLLAFYTVVCSRRKWVTLGVYLVTLSAGVAIYGAMPHQARSLFSAISRAPLTEPTCGEPVEPNGVLNSLGLRRMASFGPIGLGVSALGLVGLLTTPRKSRGVAAVAAFLLITGSFGLVLFSRLWESHNLALGILAPVAALLCGRGLCVLWQLPGFNGRRSRAVRYVSRLACIVTITLLATTACRRIHDTEALDYNKAGLRIGDWIERHHGMSLAIRLGDAHRLLASAATAAFYARCPLQDGDFAKAVGAAPNPPAVSLSNPPTASFLLVPAHSGGPPVVPPHYERVKVLSEHTPRWHLWRRKAD